MTESTHEQRSLSDQELMELIKKFKEANPRLAEAMRIFDLSDERYQATINALYGPRISWSNSANDAINRSL